MWQGSKKSRSSDRRPDRFRNRFPIHFRRVDGKVTLLSMPDEPGSNTAEESSSKQNTTLQVRIVLNDLSLKGVGVYTSIPLAVGQEINLTLTAPSPISIHCKVIWCQEYNVNSHILSPQSFPYRLGLEFILKTSEEKKAVEDLYQNVISSFSSAA